MDRKRQKRAIEKSNESETFNLVQVDHIPTRDNIVFEPFTNIMALLTDIDHTDDSTITNDVKENDTSIAIDIF